MLRKTALIPFVAALGLVVNVIVAWMLSHGEETLNTRAALLHVLGDLFGSVSALIAGAVTYFTGWTAIDPILSLVICALILFSGFRLMREALHVLMEGVPSFLDLPEVGRAMAGIQGVASVHDLHIWTLSSDTVMLSAHVTDGEVNYRAIAADQRFHRYVAELRHAPASQIEDPSERLAFWINAYNALAIRGILDGGSPSTFFGRIGYFKSSTYEVGGRTTNLYDLERKVIIRLGEPRSHFAINCASRSCPVLRSEAYVAEKLDAQLDDAARRFINDPSKNRFDVENRIAHLSKIFDWFEKDFTGHSGSVQKYIAQYVEDKSIAEMLKNESLRVKHLKYNWNVTGTFSK